LIERRRFLLTLPFARIWLISFAATAAGFQLFPTVPLRLRELGAPPAASGLFLTALTFGSAISAAWTGSLGDLFGRRRVLSGAGVGLALFAALYAVVETWWLLPLLGLAHGVVWSALLTGSSAEAASIVPESRRAEGIAWFSVASTLAVVVAPALGFQVLERHGWPWLCAGMVALLLGLALAARGLPPAPRPVADWRRHLVSRHAVEWGVLRVSLVMLLVSFGYGGTTSFVALFAEEHRIEPPGIYFTAFALSILVLRPVVGPLVDRVGAYRALPPSIALAAAGLALLPFQRDAAGLAVAALVFGAGFSTLYPAFSSLMLARVGPARHGAAFGAMLAAFDIGIGAGSLVFGPLIEGFGARAAWLFAALAALAAWPLLRRFDRAGG